MEKYLRAIIGARYWEDSSLNGVSDKAKNMPLIEGDNWIIDIDLENGKIENWKMGDTAEIHYKSVDRNSFYLLDEDKNILKKYENEYVVDVMCPTDNGYGDYVIMDIDKDGFILNFNSQSIENVEWQEIA